MMDELKQQFYEVMHKYQKPFSEEGVTANLTQWYEQKQGLLQLLRRHPLWNEKELAIVFRVEERREIDRATVDETRAARGRQSGEQRRGVDVESLRGGRIDALSIVASTAGSNSAPSQPSAIAPRAHSTAPLRA